MTEEEAESVQTSIARNRPYGDERWQKVQAKTPRFNAHASQRRAAQSNPKRFG